MIGDDDLEECRKIAIKHPAVQKLLASYSVLMESPYADSYLTGHKILTSWNKEIEDNKNSFKLLQTEDKHFDRAFKVITSFDSIITALDNIRQKMTPEQREDVDKKKKLKKMSETVVIS